MRNVRLLTKEKVMKLKSAFVGLLLGLALVSVDVTAQTRCSTAPQAVRLIRRWLARCSRLSSGSSESYFDGLEKRRRMTGISWSAMTVVIGSESSPCA